MHHAPIMIRSILLTVLIASVHLQPAFAQFEELAGRRVRLSLQPVPDGIVTKVAGVLTTVSSDSLTFSSDGNVRSIPRSFVAGLDVSTGLRRQTGRGALIGAGSGALLLGGLAAITNDPNQCATNGGFICFEFSNAEAFVLGALPGALLGLLLGTMIGYATQVDRWEAVDLQLAAFPGARSRLGIPRPGIRLAVAF